MNRSAILLTIWALSACDDSPKTYSSCILKAANSGGNNYATILATQACEDKFKTALKIFPVGTAQLTLDSGKPTVTFRLTNKDRDYLILNVQIDFMVLDAANGKQIDAYLFTFEPNIRPGTEATMIGALPTIPKGWRWGIARAEGVNVR